MREADVGSRPSIHPKCFLNACTASKPDARSSRDGGIKLVAPAGIEPTSRANLALTVYKAAALPLSYGALVAAPGYAPGFARL